MTALTNFLRAVAALIFVGLLSAGSWLGYQRLSTPDPRLVAAEKELADERARGEKLKTDLAAKEKEVARLDTAVRLLKVDRRVARIDVLEQWTPEKSDRPHTKLRFIEVDEAGQPIGEPKIMTIDGDVLYVDYWVVKFDDKFVEKGNDPLRGASICLLRRLFGEYQQPSEGQVVDAAGQRPVAYGRGAPLSEFESDLWQNFWNYANDREKAESAGVRAAHGEAPSIKLMPGKSYRIVIRSSGGLAVEPETPLPKALPEPV
jgi:hypothetical protein